MKIAVVTVGRSDYGLYVPLLRRLLQTPELDLSIVAAAAHLDEAQGHTVDQITADGFPIARRVPFPESPNPRIPESPNAVAARAMGQGTARFAETFQELAPDIVVVLGDRMEMHAAAVAAVPLRIPLAHIHGGELTQGAIDDALRHSMTKLSHLHFAATADSARRIAQMGEEAWRITFTGALSLDNARQLDRPTGAELRARYRLDPARPFLLVTLHSATLDAGDPGQDARTLISALADRSEQFLCTQPNADPGAAAIDAEFHRWAARDPGRVRYESSLGPANFVAAMEHAAAMVGNSSAGIIEARHYGLPVVNIGSRQAGRLRGGNVIDVESTVGAIGQAIDRASSKAFRSSFADDPNPYGDGHAAERIVRVLVEAPDAQTLLHKRFADLPVARAWSLPPLPDAASKLT